MTLSLLQRPAVQLIVGCCVNVWAVSAFFGTFQSVVHLAATVNPGKGFEAIQALMQGFKISQAVSTPKQREDPIKVG